MADKIKKIIRMVLFGIILCISITAVTMVLVPKWHESRWTPSNTIISFYETSRQSLDVIFYGSSVIVAAADPFQLYNDFGISSYNLGLQSQNMQGTYSWLQESFSYQNPKVAVVEVKALGHKKEKEEPLVRRSYEYMRWGKAKLKYALDYCTENDEADLFSYLFPPFIYHSRWNELNREDFRFVEGDNKSVLRGFCFLYGTKVNKEFSGLSGTGNAEGDGYLERELSYLKKIISLCKEQNVSLIFTKTTDPKWTEDMHAYTEAVAKTYNIPFIDFNMKEIMEAAGINPEKVMDDHMHVNMVGAEKITEYLGKYIKDNYELSDHRVLDSSAHKEFEAGMSVYESCKYDSALAMQNDLHSWLQMVIEGNHYCVLSAVPKTAAVFDDKTLKLLAHLDFDKLFIQNLKEPEFPVSAAVTGEHKDYYFSEKKKVNLHGMFEDGNVYDISADKDSCSISVNDDIYISDCSQCSFVVYDELTGQVADAVSVENADDGSVILVR